MKTGVIQIIDSLDIGGAEVLAVDIANALQKKQMNSHICVTRKEGDLKHNILKETGYCFLNRKRILDTKALNKVTRYIKVNNILIVHAHASSFFFAFLIKMINPKIKLIWHDHFGVSQNLEHRKLFPLHFISKYFKSIISVNSKLQNWALNKLKCKQVYFLNNFSTFKNDESLTTLKGIKGKRIVHLAAFRPQKDHLTLITGFNNFLKQSSINKNWTLHLIGGFNDQIYFNKIKELIKDKKLENSVFIYGACLDIKNILTQADIGVLSSKSEGLPVSLLEYGLAKLPVIVTNVGECANVVKNNVMGFVIAPENSTELSDKLEELVNSEEKRFNFSLALHQKIKKEYSKENFINQLLKIYNI